MALTKTSADCLRPDDVFAASAGPDLAGRKVVKVVRRNAFSVFLKVTGADPDVVLPRDDVFTVTR